MVYHELNELNVCSSIWLLFFHEFFLKTENEG